jgi:hypothetical protein
MIALPAEEPDRAKKRERRLYAAEDPRSTMSLAAATAKPASTFKGAEYARWYDQAPQEKSAQAQTWYTRGQNMVVAYTKAEAGAVLTRADQPDEYMVLLPSADSVVRVAAGEQSETVNGNSLVVVPPGASSIEVKAGGTIVRIFSSNALDLLPICSNADSYANEPDPNVKPFAPWPNPPGGFAIRSYSLDIPKSPTRFGRLFRCSTIMVNVIHPSPPRSTTNLSPHHHADFEQGSLCLEGAYTHYLRWPWVTDKAAWRADAAELCRAPSLCIIPPPAIHTSQSMDESNVLVDIFAPPRADFSAKPGWVLNADDYPSPSSAS